MDTLTGMRLFKKVAETGSFSAAGRAIGLAPSSVSRQISALEECDEWKPAQDKSLKDNILAFQIAQRRAQT